MNRVPWESPPQDVRGRTFGGPSALRGAGLTLAWGGALWLAGVVTPLTAMHLSRLAPVLTRPLAHAGAVVACAVVASAGGVGVAGWAAAAGWPVDGTRSRDPYAYMEPSGWDGVSGPKRSWDGASGGSFSSVRWRLPVDTGRAALLDALRPAVRQRRLVLVGLHACGDLSPTLLSVNMPQGAHHSDLSHQPAAPTDTADVTAARKKVADILGGWLREIDGSSL